MSEERTYKNLAATKNIKMRPIDVGEFCYQRTDMLRSFSFGLFGQNLIKKPDTPDSIKYFY